MVAQVFLTKDDIRNTVNHKDGNKFNNVVSNLEWVTQKENNAHAAKIGLRGGFGEKSPGCKYSDEVIIKMRTDYETGLYTQADIARKYGMSKMNAHRVLTYKLRTDVI